MIEKSGIYQITNKQTGGYYIGSSINMNVRWYHHKRNAKKGYKQSPRLYSSMRKYGIEMFDIIPLLICEKNDLQFYEQKLLDKHYGMSNCYNCSRYADAPWRGKKMTNKQRRDLSKARKGIPAWNKGIPRTENEKKNISIKTKEAMSKLDNSCSEKTKRKLSKVLKGRTFSEESRKKMSISRLGKITWNKNKPHPAAAKLTGLQVREIRNKYVPWKYGAYKLAKEYSVNHSTIDAIINNKIWKYIV